ncbi:MAG: prepilin-type N-terminal cleavage/methylation domain-containing protein [Desulfatiglandales bacterium]
MAERKHHKTGPDENGFTLIEVILAISILSFGLLAVASMQVSAIRGNAFASDVTEGTTVASDKLEKLIQAGLADYSDLADPEDPEEQGRYLISWNVAEDHILERTKTVNVIVTWTDHGHSKQVSLSGIVPEII